MSSVSRAAEVAQGTKLRNSCDACAAAKIKCTQEKPECSYCAKRLKVCVYSASKRVKRLMRGRRHDASEGSVSRTATASTIFVSPLSTAPELTGSCSTLSSTNGTDIVITGAPDPTTPLSGQDWPDFLAALRSPELTTSPTGQGASTEWANLNVSMDSFTYLDESIFDFPIPVARLDQCNPTTQKPDGNGAVAGTNTTNTLLGSLVRANSGLAKDASSCRADMRTGAISSLPSSRDDSIEMQQCQDDHGTSTTPPRCQCLMRTLKILAQLSMDSCESWSTSKDGGVASIQHSNFEQLHDQIEHVSSELDKVLQCPCFKNGDILVLLSLVIFKIQAWCASAVNTATNDNQSEASSGGESDAQDFNSRLALPSPWSDPDGEESEGEDQRRIFVQHILSRLTGLRTLIGRLSQQFANAEAESCLSTSLVPTSQNCFEPVPQDKIFVLPFPVALLRPLSSEMNDRLCGLSRAIAEKLRVA